MPQLPNWRDAQAVSTYITSVLAFLLSIVTTFHPGFKEPALVQALVPSIGLIVAGIAQAVNVATHRAAHALAVKVPVVGPQGVTGPKGDKGDPGITPTLDVNDVIQSAADVVVRRLASGASSQ